MLAGHMLLVTFAILTEELISSGNVFGITLSILPFFMLLFITAFEVLVRTRPVGRSAVGIVGQHDRPGG
jgi:hypothetical protein